MVKKLLKYGWLVTSFGLLFIPTVTAANVARKLYLPIIRVEGSFHAFMLKTAVRQTQSPQYQLLNSKQVSVGPEGILFFRENGKEFVCVALGSRFAKKVGETFNITFAEAGIVPCIVADIKSDRHTDDTNTFTLHGSGKERCVVEVVVHPKYIPAEVAKRGSYDVSKTLSGKVLAIQKRGISSWRRALDAQTLR